MLTFEGNPPTVQSMNILLDLDGTLADPFLAISSSLNYAFDHFKIPRPSTATIRKMIGPPLQVSLRDYMEIKDEKQIAAVIEKYREHHVRDGLALYKLYPGVLEALQTLVQHHRLFTATSKPTVMADPILERTKAKPFFNTIYGAELNGTRSEKPELIRYILEQEQLDPADTVMIGDRKHDLIGAEKNQVVGYGVLWGFGDREELETYGAKKIFSTWNELVNSFTVEK